MDETKNKKQNEPRSTRFYVYLFLVFIGFTIAVSVMYFSYSLYINRLGSAVVAAAQDGVKKIQEVALLPRFSSTENEDFDSLDSAQKLDAISKSSASSLDLDIKIKTVEDRPVLDYIFFSKKYYLKDIVQVKPGLCPAAITVDTKKESASQNIKNAQTILRSFAGLETLSVTGKLDEQTRNTLYLFQKQFFDVIYFGSKTDRPTRVLDPETVRFVNILCGFEKDTYTVGVPHLRYLVQETGEIVDYNIETKDSTVLNKKLELGAGEAMFAPSGNYLVVRKSLSGNITTKIININNDLVLDLEPGIKDVSISDDDKLVYSVAQGDTLILKNYDTKAKKASELLRLPMTEWSFHFKDNKTLRVYSKPTGLAMGISLLVNLTDKSIKNETKPILGLTPKKTDNKNYLLLGQGGEGKATLLVLNTKNNTIYSLERQTFVEKCASELFTEGVLCAEPKNLPQDEAYPDFWYKNLLTSDDRLIYRSLTSTTTKVISELSNYHMSFKNIKITTSGIYFQDARTGSLHILEL